MAPLLLFGSNHREVEISRLRELTEQSDSVAARLCELRASGAIEGAVLISTCNRFEVLIEASSERRADLVREVLGEPSIPTIILENDCAVHHLLRVATGLESLVRGEDQIIGQIRRAFQRAEDSGILSRGLHILRTRLLHAARDLRRELGLGPRAPSVASVAATELAKAGPRLAVVGAGEMARLALETLRKRRVHDVLVVNRTRSRAEALARNFDGTAMSLDEFSRATPALDGVLFAVHCDTTLLEPGQIPGLSLAIDVGHPSVISPELQSQDGLKVIDLDVLGAIAAQHVRKYENTLETADTLAASRAHRIFADTTAVGAQLSGVVDLHVEGALSEFDRALASSLQHLDNCDRERVRDILVRAAKRTAHYHMRDLRQVLAQ